MVVTDPVGCNAPEVAKTSANLKATEILTTVGAVTNGTEAKVKVKAMACVNTECPAGGVGEEITTVCAGEGTAIIAGLVKTYILAPENLDLTL